MPRARNIKYNFFVNDELGELDPLARLLFIGLWTIADFKGDVEWRPKKIKTLLLPYDNCDIQKLAINLDQSGFIRFYSNTKNTYLNIVKFSVHQNPHKNEVTKGSDIPEYSEELRQHVDLKGLTINHDLSGLNQNYSASDRADSLSLNPESQEKPKKYSPDDLKLAEYMYKKIKEKWPHTKKPNWDNWSNEIRKLRETRKIDHKLMCEAFVFANNDDTPRGANNFCWSPNVRSPLKLRDHFDNLVVQMGTGGNQHQAASQAWEKLVGQLSNWQEATLDDPTKAAVKAIGGLRALATSNESNLPFRRKEFIAEYRA